MTDAAVQEVLDEVFSALEALETQAGAILEFLKERRVVCDEDLAPFWEKAASASNVRWRATRVRVNYLLASAPQGGDSSQEKSPAAIETKKDQQAMEPPSEEHEEQKQTSAPTNGEDAKNEAGGEARQTKEANRGGEGDAKDRPADQGAA